MVGWHPRLNGHEFAPGQCCSPYGLKEWDTTEKLNKKKQNTANKMHLTRSPNHRPNTLQVDFKRNTEVLFCKSSDE